MAEITPVDIVNIEFRRSLRGYATGEVDEFLQQVSDSLFRALEEAQRLRLQVEGLNEQVKRYQQTENLIKNALVLAERSADELKAHALQEADTIRREAAQQLNAERSAVETLHQSRLRIMSELRAVLTAHISLLDAQEQRQHSTDQEREGGE